MIWISMEKQTFDLSPEDIKDFKAFGERLFLREFKKRHKDKLFYVLRVDDNKLIATWRNKTWKST